MTQSDNPLRRHFRQPSIYVRLPSAGKYYPPGTINMPINGELPVYPMTALDEITARTPDALFNGSATVEIFRSCVPSIVDPWQIPATDLNALLVAVRIASYGHSMEVNSICPKCGHEHNFDLDLRTVLDGFQLANYDEPLVLGDLTVYFTPLNYAQLNENSKVQFDNQKLIDVITSSDLPDERKIKDLGDSFRKISELTINTIANGIGAIKTPEAMVNDKAHINEFLHNCNKQIFERIKDQAIALRQGTEIKPLNITCHECEWEYRQEFTLDMTNFFETAS